MLDQRIERATRFEGESFMVGLYLRKRIQHHNCADDSPQGLSSWAHHSLSAASSFSTAETLSSIVCDLSVRDPYTNVALYAYNALVMQKCMCLTDQSHDIIPRALYHAA